MKKSEQDFIIVFGGIFFGAIFIAFLLSFLVNLDDSSPVQIDTSEGARQQITQEMVRQGADPNEAEVFTRELYKAQKEWEQGRK